MVACPKCVVNNTLDSAFCKKCGAILPISMIEEEQEKLKEIVTKGMESYQNGNLEEAMAIADHSILTNPSYGEAYALKGLVHSEIEPMPKHWMPMSQLSPLIQIQRSTKSS